MSKYLFILYALTCKVNVYTNPQIFKYVPIFQVLNLIKMDI